MSFNPIKINDRTYTLFGIYLCKDGLKSKESEILDKYSFKENIKENEKVENKTKFVSED